MTLSEAWRFEALGKGGRTLVLTRRSGETIRIGDDIVVTVLTTQSGQVRVGITAPRDIAVHREEVYERIGKEEKENPEADPTNNSAP